MAKKIALLLDYNDNYAKTVVDGVAKYFIRNRCLLLRRVPSVTFEPLTAQPSNRRRLKNLNTDRGVK